MEPNQQASEVFAFWRLTQEIQASFQGFVRFSCGVTQTITKGERRLMIEQFHQPDDIAAATSRFVIRLAGLEILWITASCDDAPRSPMHICRPASARRCAAPAPPWWCSGRKTCWRRRKCNPRCQSRTCRPRQHTTLPNRHPRSDPACPVQRHARPHYSTEPLMRPVSPAVGTLLDNTLPLTSALPRAATPPTSASPTEVRSPKTHPPAPMADTSLENTLP